MSNSIDNMEREIPHRLADAWERTTTHADAIDALAASRGLFRDLAGWQSTLVAEALESGASWERVGTALGTTRQAAWARFRDVAEQAEGRRKPMPEQVKALQQRLNDDVHALRAELKTADSRWRAARDELQRGLRELDRKRLEERKELRERLRQTADRLGNEIRRLREPPE